MEQFFAAISKGLVSLSMGASALLPFGSHIPTTIDATPMKKEITVSPQQFISLKKTLTMMGLTVHLDMSTPTAGGPITGTVNGDCNGVITGNYDGPAAQTFKGSGTITCPVIVEVHGKVNFDGTLDQTTKKATINYSATTDTGMSKAGTTTVTY